jgi:hypothetical protein
LQKSEQIEQQIKESMQKAVAKPNEAIMNVAGFGHALLAAKLWSLNEQAKMQEDGVEQIVPQH